MVAFLVADCFRSRMKEASLRLAEASQAAAAAVVVVVVAAAAAAAADDDDDDDDDDVDDDDDDDDDYDDDDDDDDYYYDAKNMCLTPYRDDHLTITRSLIHHGCYNLRQGKCQRVRLAKSTFRLNPSRHPRTTSDASKSKGFRP